ncbi:hypothetical protein GCM10012275_04000 [Longimycelium tulufanense]|uniref:Carboxymuconolactone decarboxylase-like domain-containing protein n=1 Tax=Longimycelium tulufanense TaxID=907463 RepID=A0A8J3C9U3_9PSEU|nr:carboxymuconolactone decarboxylase family protein [Longimycelium tulufanense]GGM35990.1 hypothetical protein GCM10012275_04000 [Longimycelium tulufanense]
MSLDELHQRGRKTFAHLVPDGEERLDTIFRAAPALGELAVGTVYGHLHHRHVLDPRTREAAALAATIAAGCTETPLLLQVRIGLAAGLAPAEVVELLVASAAYAGVPRAMQALGRVEEVLGEAGTPLPTFPAPRAALLGLLDRLRAGDDDAIAEHLDPEFTRRAALAELRTLASTPASVQVLTTSPATALAVFAENDDDRPLAVVHAMTHAGRIADLACLRPGG